MIQEILCLGVELLCRFLTQNVDLYLAMYQKSVFKGLFDVEFHFYSNDFTQFSRMQSLRFLRRRLKPTFVSSFSFISGHQFPFLTGQMVVLFSLFPTEIVFSSFEKEG